MMMSIQAKAMVTYTITLGKEDIEKVKNYVDENREDFLTGEKYTESEFINAVWELYNSGEISLYDDYVESDFSTEEIEWSSFEDRTADEILRRV